MASICHGCFRKIAQLDQFEEVKLPVTLTCVSILLAFLIVYYASWPVCWPCISSTYLSTLIRLHQIVFWENFLSSDLAKIAVKKSKSFEKSILIQKNQLRFDEKLSKDAINSRPFVTDQGSQNQKKHFDKHESTLLPIATPTKTNSEKINAA